ncbi:hypothetical protein AGLY_008229 [Aphis glycines]|uniref:Uncharacterized protein n=1 Tax=Aphis glycines TaxID=307491 RepID=A0A6G0TLT5_APHGL|nr:hypothetical protein AGLY_008229 [Aphis glycines]
MPHSFFKCLCKFLKWTYDFSHFGHGNWPSTLNKEDNSLISHNLKKFSFYKKVMSYKFFRVYSSIPFTGYAIQWKHILAEKLICLFICFYQLSYNKALIELRKATFQLKDFFKSLMCHRPKFHSEGQNETNLGEVVVSVTTKVHVNKNLKYKSASAKQRSDYAHQNDTDNNGHWLYLLD